MSESFSKVTTISDEYKYSNIQIKWPSNIICIRAIYEYFWTFVRFIICGIRIYSDIRLVNYVASKYIRIFVRVHFMIFAHHWEALPRAALPAPSFLSSFCHL